MKKSTFEIQPTTFYEPDLEHNKDENDVTINILRKQHLQTLFPIITGLFITSMAFLIAGYCWNLSFPVNKPIWTSSYVVLTTGVAIAVLATLIYASILLQINICSTHCNPFDRRFISIVCFYEPKDHDRG